MQEHVYCSTSQHRDTLARSQPLWVSVPSPGEITADRRELWHLSGCDPWSMVQRPTSDCRPFSSDRAKPLQAGVLFCPPQTAAGLWIIKIFQKGTRDWHQKNSLYIDLCTEYRPGLFPFQPRIHLGSQRHRKSISRSRNMPQQMYYSASEGPHWVIGIHREIGPYYIIRSESTGGEISALSENRYEQALLCWYPGRGVDRRRLLTFGLSRAEVIPMPRWRLFYSPYEAFWSPSSTHYIISSRGLGALMDQSTWVLCSGDITLRTLILRQ